jgi:hypothetical protein
MPSCLCVFVFAMSSVFLLCASVSLWFSRCLRCEASAFEIAGGGHGELVGVEMGADGVLHLITIDGEEGNSGPWGNSISTG